MTTSLWTRVVALGIVVTASVAGNVSMSASEFSTRPVPFNASRPGGMVKSGSDSSRVLPAATTAPAVNANSAGLTRPAAAITADASDDGEVVPAIFARDPDVRFLFYRQLSKWM